MTREERQRAGEKGRAFAVRRLREESEKGNYMDELGEHPEEFYVAADRAYRAEMRRILKLARAKR